MAEDFKERMLRRHIFCAAKNKNQDNIFDHVCKMKIEINGYVVFWQA